MEISVISSNSQDTFRPSDVCSSLLSHLPAAPCRAKVGPPSVRACLMRLSLFGRDAGASEGKSFGEMHAKYSRLWSSHADSHIVIMEKVIFHMWLPKTTSRKLWGQTAATWCDTSRRGLPFHPSSLFPSKRTSTKVGECGVNCYMLFVREVV